MATETLAKELEIEGRKNDIDIKTPETSSEISQTRNRAEFLSSFTQEENKAIMRKVDRRFLILIGLMYVIKNVSISAMSQQEKWLTVIQIDYQNAASAKVLQVGQKSNILVELHMTANQYNWVQSIYFVSTTPT